MKNAMCLSTFDDTRLSYSIQLTSSYISHISGLSQGTKHSNKIKVKSIYSEKNLLYFHMPHPVQ